MNRLDVGRAIHSYRQPPEEKAVLDFETPLGRARIVRDHWHAEPGEYRAFVNGFAIEPGGFYAFADAKQALVRYLERKKIEQMSVLRKRLRLEQDAIRALKQFEPSLTPASSTQNPMQYNEDGEAD